jgi:urease accessory protein
VILGDSPVLTVNRLLPADGAVVALATLSLTAGDRIKSRHRFTADDGTPIYLNLPRGTVLRDGDLLGGDLLGADGNGLMRVVAKPEPVIVVTATTAFDLLRAAYHLGNRHVSLQLAPDRLILEPDPVLEGMLAQLGGLTLTPATLPFEPETGAYRSTPHRHDHDHDHN